MFAGRPGEAPYEADATPGPTNLYGETKLDGERAVISEYGKGEGKGKEGLGVVLRVPVLYGDAEVPGESAVNVLLDTVWKAQQQQQGIEGGDGGTQEKIKMDHWAKRYPTNTEDVGRVCHGMFCFVVSSCLRSPPVRLFSPCRCVACLLSLYLPT